MTPTMARCPGQRRKRLSRLPPPLVRWVCRSMKPGMTVWSERSMRVAPDGTWMSSPTASRRVPRTRMVTFSRTLPSTPSMRRPATTAVTSVVSGKVTLWASRDAGAAAHPVNSNASSTALRVNRARSRRWPFLPSACFAMVLSLLVSTPVKATSNDSRATAPSLVPAESANPPGGWRRTQAATGRSPGPCTEHLP